MTSVFIRDTQKRDPQVGGGGGGELSGAAPARDSALGIWPAGQGENVFLFLWTNFSQQPLETGPDAIANTQGREACERSYFITNFSMMPETTGRKTELFQCTREAP